MEAISQLLEEIPCALSWMWMRPLESLQIEALTVVAVVPGYLLTQLGRQLDPKVSWDDPGVVYGA